MRKLAGKAHPKIYKVVSLFKSEQAATEVTLMQVAAGELPVRKLIPAHSYSWDMLHVGLEHVGSLHAILHMLLSPQLMVYS